MVQFLIPKYSTMNIKDAMRWIEKSEPRDLVSVL